MSTFLIVYISFMVFTSLFFISGALNKGLGVIHEKWRALEKVQLPVFVMYLSILLAVVLWPLFWGFTFVSRSLGKGKRHGRT